MILKWKEITYDNLMDFEKVMKLYDESFPIEVREPHDVFIKSLQYGTRCFPNHYRFLVGYEGDELVSFATAHYLAEVNIGFIVYIATKPKLRSKGLGSLTLMRMEKILNIDAKNAGYDSLKSLVLETEIEELAKSNMEKEECVRRSLFFQSNGYKPYKEINYFQPPLHEVGGKVSLELFIKEFSKDDIKLANMKQIIQSIYKEKYYTVNGLNEKNLHRFLSEMGIQSDFH